MAIEDAVFDIVEDEFKNPDETDEHHKYGQVNLLFQEESVDKEKH